MIRAAWFGVVTVVATAWYSSRSILGGLRGAAHEHHDAVQRGWARALLRAAGTTVDADGLQHLERQKAAILVSNHQSNFDIFSLLAALPVSIRFVSKRELARIPLLAQAMKAAGHVFIDRSDRRGSVLAMRHAAERMMTEGLYLGLFPEGTRSKDGRLGDFKKGSRAGDRDPVAYRPDRDRRWIQAGFSWKDQAGHDPGPSRQSDSDRGPGARRSRRGGGRGERSGRPAASSASIGIGRGDLNLTGRVSLPLNTPHR